MVRCMPLTKVFFTLNTQGAEGDDEASAALWSLGEVLMTMAKFMAPFTPFFAGIPVALS